MTGILLALCPGALAADKSDVGVNQRLEPRTVIRIDILDPATERIEWIGEVADVVTSGPNLPVQAELFDPTGLSLGMVASGSITTLAAGPGTYELQPDDAIDIDGDLQGESDPLEEWSIRVLDPTDTEIEGRVWSRSWHIDAGTFEATGATDASFYAVVPGGATGSDAVVELKADGLAGNRFFFAASERGILNGNGRSRPYGAEWGALASYEIYLEPPDPAIVSYSWITPALSNVSITPDGTCGGIAPGFIGATLELDSNVDGIAHLVCDLNDDGVFDQTSDDDFHLLVRVDPGTNVFTWDGLDNLDLAVPAGTYECVMKLTVAEFHFVASDIETSYEGFRLFEVDAIGNRAGLPMYWNDAEVQADAVQMPNFDIGLEMSGPFGVFSGLYTDPAQPNVNARSWGAFQQQSKGDETYLDTYTWLGADESAPFPIDVLDVSLDADLDGLPDPAETCLYNTDPNDPDTDDDGAGDLSEATVAASDPLVPDSDGDGLLDGEELPDELNPTDTDGDGLEDTVDDDDDGDGLLTADESGWTDGDGDGLADHLDPDSDDDTVPDGVEGLGDTDGDALPDFQDPNDDGDSLDTPLEDVNGNGDPTDDDSDADGVPDYLDADDDDDGIASADEHDLDGDGLADDADGDSIPNYLDPDDDDDGIDSVTEGAGDTDGDGTPDFLDLDSDDDSVADGVDGPGDTDGDQVPDFQDDDDDGDSIPTIGEDLDGDGDPTNDNTDGDKFPNYLDADDEGDTVLTVNEYDLDEDGVPDDADGDGVPNYLDLDDDDDGIPTDQEGDSDTDGDGVPDFLDLDSDNDTLADREESTRDSDADFAPDFQDSDDDGDGIDTFEELGDAAGTPGSSDKENMGDPSAAPDSDGDGDPDWLDPDDDDDGIETLLEGGFGDDFDGDGDPNHLDLDSDADGLLDGDEGPEDRDGDGGRNFVDLDADGDGYDDTFEGEVDSDADEEPDFLDPDDDGDGVPTLEEREGDTDGDGIDDRLDTDDDGDGILTYDEVQDGLLHGDDVDGDGDGNWVDIDADGDELKDAKEGRKDSDDDGVPNYLDPDGGYVEWYRGSGLSLACSGTGASPVGGGLAVMLALAFIRRRTM